MNGAAAQIPSQSIRALVTQNATAAARPLASPAGLSPTDIHSKARTQAVEFEAMFLNNMFSQMFTGVDGDGPLGGSGAGGVWRSFLTDEYAKSFAKAGGIGIADHVYSALLAQQEVRAS
jgi:Rod binding domain-containing protein